MKIDVLTLFPGIFGGALSESILGIARGKGLIDVRIWDIREFAADRHRKLDDRPYGGGPGMVMMAEPVVACAEHVLRERGGDARVILLSPKGRRLTQETARGLADEGHLLLLCGRYEGFDERVRLVLEPDEVSVGDFVLSGGEFAALVLVDVVARLLPGVLGSEASLDEESFAEGDLLEYPQYTRPVEYRGLRVPDVLLSGHHEKIRIWREQMARRRTESRRPKER